MADTRPVSRRKGRIERHGAGLRVVVYAGDDPVTGRRVYERATIKAPTTPPGSGPRTS